MADEKDKEAKAAPAPGATGTERSTSEDQYSTSPSGTMGTPRAASGKSSTETYYLRDGVVHNHVVKGEHQVLDRFGQSAELTPQQYTAFKDKFHTKAEYEAAKSGKDALADGASAATTFSGEMEQTTPEERSAENNEPAKGKGASNPSGEKGTPPSQ